MGSHQKDKRAGLKGLLLVKIRDNLNIKNVTKVMDYIEFTE